MSVRMAATECAFLAQNMAQSLLGATVGQGSDEERVARMTDAFATWPLLCRRMAELEESAPRSSNAGRDRDDELRERRAAFVERYAPKTGDAA